MSTKSKGEGPNGPETSDPVIIKKYANRRLYDTSASAYVTLEHLRDLVKDGVDFVVQDAKSGEDLTRQVLAQIIFEQENKGQTMLPVSFLRQLIQIYGDSMQAFVPSYLDMSLESFTKSREQWREQMTKAVGAATPALYEEHVRRNMALFEQMMKAWASMAQPATAARNPFAALMTSPTGAAANPLEAFTAMQQQMFEMQRQLVELSQRSMGMGKGTDG
jgi:polyhydroxyalkanoate synthesis repressor PhaR